MSLEAAMAVSLVAIGLGALIERKRQGRQQSSASDPLAALFAPSALGNIIDGANRRMCRQLVDRHFRGCGRLAVRQQQEPRRARALAALEVSRMAGTDHVVAASEIEEVIFLPAPDRSAEAA